VLFYQQNIPKIVISGPRCSDVSQQRGTQPIGAKENEYSLLLYAVFAEDRYIERDRWNF
jgi:hypothetical protein